MTHLFWVTQARTASACPRIFYFDYRRSIQSETTSVRMTTFSETNEGEVSACGTLFHQMIELFQQKAGQAAELLQAVQVALPQNLEQGTQVIHDAFMAYLVRECLRRPLLHAKRVERQQAFVQAVHRYLHKLATWIYTAGQTGRPAADVMHDFFGDQRKQVDLVFDLGPDRTPVRVRGNLDYLFFDDRRGKYQLIDFKLLPATAISKDLLQIALYAFMHDRQYGTRPDTAVMYLHPELQIADQSWELIQNSRGKIFDLLASMVAWADYDEERQVGLKPWGEPALCPHCPWNRQGECTRRLGPVTEGGAVRWHTENLATLDSSRMRAPESPPETPPGIARDDANHNDRQSVLEVSITVPITTSIKIDGPSDSPSTAPESDARDSVQSSPVVGSINAEVTPGALLLGYTVANRLPVTMPVSDLKTHAAVVGAAGSGKSWLAKVIVEEAILQGIPVLAIDPQGDLVQFLHAGKPPADADPHFLTTQRYFRQQAEVRIWTPGSSHGQRLCLSPLMLPKPEEIRDENPIRRKEEWEAMLSVVATNLVSLANASGDRETQATFLLEILRRVTDSSRYEPLTLSKLIALMEAPDALGIHDADHLIKISERQRLTQRLYARERGPSAHLFTGGIPLNLNHFVTPLIPSKTPLNVIYLNALSDDDQKQYFVASLGAEIYRWMMTTPGSGETRLLVFLDEARDFLPAGTRKPPAKEPLTRLFSQGRKFGIGVLICTQSPRSVEYQIFSNASTKIIGRLEASQDSKRVTEWFSSQSSTPAWVADRTGADAGILVGRWPGMETSLEGTPFRSRHLYSLHEGAWSPERVANEWTQSPLAEQLAKLAE